MMIEHETAQSRLKKVGGVATKLCSRCRRTLPLTQFYNQSAPPDGKDYYCKECRNKEIAKYRKANRAEISEQQRIRRRIRTNTLVCGCGCDIPKRDYPFRAGERVV